MNKVSYALGLGIGRQLAQMGAEDLNIDDFAQAIKDIIAGNEPKVSDAEAQTIVQDFFKKQEEKQEEKKLALKCWFIQLVNDGDFTVEKAASKVNMTSEDFLKKKEEYKKETL